MRVKAFQVCIGVPPAKLKNWTGKIIDQELSDLVVNLAEVRDLYDELADLTPEKKVRARREAAYMRSRWKHVLQHDPFYNPNFNYNRPDFSLSHAPIVPTPW